MQAKRDVSLNPDNRSKHLTSVEELIQLNIKDFFHITKSSYSFLESILKPKKIIECAKKLNMHSVCMADESNLFGSLEFNLEASKNNIKPINGLRTKLLIKNQLFDITLLAQDSTGYENLVKLASYIYLYNLKDNLEKHIRLDQLKDNSKGIILISSYLNVDSLIKESSILNELKTFLYKKIYLELNRCKPNYNTESQYINLGINLELPMLAANDVLFGDVSQFEAHDILLCIAGRNKKAETSRKTSNNQFYFKSGMDMFDLFKDIPIAVLNNIFLSQRCNFILKELPPLLPRFNSSVDDKQSKKLISKNNTNGQNELIEFQDNNIEIHASDHENRTIEVQAHQGLVSRLNRKHDLNLSEDELKEKYPQYFDRLQYELSVICKMDFSGYFLIVSDFVKWSKNNQVSVGPGRGSGAGAITAWCLEITELDPIEYGLIFERFLNPDRISMPDFDIDFCQQNRQKVIDYVVNKYGKDRVAQIITFGTLQAKAVIKDVGRALNLPFRYANRLTELIPFNAIAPVTLEEAIQGVAELNLAYRGLGLYSNNDDSMDKDDLLEMNKLMQEVLEYALTLEGLHRHASVHAAGVVISGEDLTKRVALYKEDGEDMAIIQASMKYAEKLGLVKFDFLGLQTLTLISETIKTIKTNQNISIDINNISLNDKKTYQMLSNADAIGVFQLEGGMIKVLKQVRPDSVQDIMALTALYRPGPMDNIQIYIKCKHGEQEPFYLHEKMKPVLEETYGVIVYQEQVIELAKVLAGYSLSGADNLRRAMGKKNKEEMDMHRNIFINGCAQNNIDEGLANQIFDSIEKFAGYGFNKAHAASYALISYQAAFLKANYKAEFIVLFLNLEVNDHVKISSLLNYAKKVGFDFKNSCINSSKSFFSIDNEKTDHGTAINYGLCAIKSVGQKIIDDIIECRSQGKFVNIFDLLKRASIMKNFNRKTLEGLIKSGSLDVFGINRATLFQNIDYLLGYMDKSKHDHNHQQFSLLNFEEIDQAELQHYEEWDEMIKLLYEFEFLGTFISTHPISIYRNNFDLSKINNFGIIRGMKVGNYKISLGGFIEAKYIKKSPKGKYINLKLSDETDIFEATIFDEKILEESGDLINEKNLILIDCDLTISEGSYKLSIKKVYNIEKYCSKPNLKLSIKIDSEPDVDKIVNYLSKLSEGDIQVNMYVKQNGFYFKLEIEPKFNISSKDIMFFKQFDSKNT